MAEQGRLGDSEDRAKGIFVDRKQKEEKKRIMRSDGIALE